MTGKRFFSVNDSISVNCGEIASAFEFITRAFDSLHQAFDINKLCCHLTGLNPWNLQSPCNLSSIDTHSESGEHHWKLTTCNVINQLLKLPTGIAAFSLIRLYVRIISESRITSYGPLLCCRFTFLQWGRGHIRHDQRKTVEIIEKVLESTRKLERF